MIDQINWNNYQTDPIFQLTFPQKEMLLPSEISLIQSLKDANASRNEIAKVVSDIRSAKTLPQLIKHQIDHSLTMIANLNLLMDCNTNTKKLY